MSVDHGQTIQFKVSTDASAYRLDIYRMGYYGGMGAREVASITNPSISISQNQPDPIVDTSYAHDKGSAGLVDCGNWGVTASWAVPQDATSGIYFAKLVREDGIAGTNYIVFVVRNDEGNSNLLFKTSDETWEAYNNWGNSSLYGPNAVAQGRSFAVSYNRPLLGRDGTLDVFGAEYSMVRYVESNGFDVSYTSAIDVATHPSLLLNHKIFLSVGHDEYWSGQERANIETARDAGVSLVFASGNEMFWKTYWTSSEDEANTPNRTLVCYKETHDSAITDPNNPNIWTGTWMDPRFSPPADGGRPKMLLPAQYSWSILSRTPPRPLPFRLHLRTCASGVIRALPIWPLVQWPRFLHTRSVVNGTKILTTVFAQRACSIYQVPRLIPPRCSSITGTLTVLARRRIV